jgi:hemoglobin
MRRSARLRITGAKGITGRMNSPLPPRFHVTRPQIEGVVAEFYDLIRRHPGLGPVFGAHVTDWPAHEEKITRFWANAILHERSYDGNPQRVHVQAGDVRAGQFEVWLALFDGVLRRQLPPETAAAWSALAHRIGRGLRMGVADRDIGPGGIPRLR